MKTNPSRREFIKTTTAAGISATVLGGISFADIACMRAPLDIVIKKGSILDGTGAEERIADIGIRNGKIVAIGNLADTEGERVIDAQGLKVTPGFIDIHSHVDTELFLAPRAESKVRQGVTTEVNGCDGSSAGPLGGSELASNLKEFKDAFEFDCPYRDMEGFFSFLDKQRCAQNMISLIGLGTIRERVIGADNRPATSDEMEQMKREVLIAIDQGCYGTSTGLEYTPGSFASTQELWELVKVVPQKHRLYATHMRNEDDTLLEAIDEAITICRNANASLQISHLKASHKINWGKQGRAIEMMEKAIADGMNVHADRYPYIAYNTGMSNFFPLWSRDGGTEKFMLRLRDKSLTGKIRKEVLERIDGLGSWDSVLISWTKSTANKIYQGKTVQQIATEKNVDPFEFVVELLLQENEQVGIVGFGMDEAGTEMVLAWRNTIVASDAGSSAPWGPGSRSRPHPRAYGTFPRAIAHYQRERKITTLPDMIRKMTSLPAWKLGLGDRGIIAEGKAADIVIFDYEKIQDRATFLDPHQFPIGIPYVVINGVPVIDNGVQTGALPGKVLRSAG
jgi:N-acyl-D-amino-acid deacylase